MTLRLATAIAVGSPVAVGLIGFFVLTMLQPESDPGQQSKQRRWYWACWAACTLFLPLCIYVAKPEVNLGAVLATAFLPALLFIVNGVMRTSYVLIPLTGGRTIGPVWPNNL